MHDGVADVLAQRRALDRGGIGGVAVSLLLHGSAAAAAMYAALHQPPPITVNTLKIRFAPAPQRRAAETLKAASAKPSAPRIEPPRPQPLKPSDPAITPEKNTVPLSPFGRSSQKGSANPPPPKANPQPPAAAVTTTDVAVGQTGVTGLEGGDFPYTLYIERMKTLVGSHWYRGQVAGDAKAVVYFVIDRDGRIRDAKIQTPSSNPVFDRNALRAVLESSPLPPLPFAYNGTYLGVHLTFR